MPEEFLYKNADRFAQPEIKEAVERFRRLPLSEREKIPILWWLLQDSTQPFKMAKHEALYTDFARTGTQRCENCSYAYLNLHHRVYICSQIQGCIKMTGWCKLWERVPNPYACDHQEDK